MIYWLLTKEVLALRGEEERFTDVPDLFMWRDVEKQKKEEETAHAAGQDGEEKAEEPEAEGEGEEAFLDDN